MNRTGLAPKGTPERFVQEAAIARQRRDLDRTLDLLKRASRKAPKDPQILLKLGDTHGLLYDYPKAEAAFQKAFDLAPLHWAQDR